jgi:hypothetical protein
VKQSLEHHLADAMKRGVTEHRLVASVSPDGLVAFMIHPLRVDGATADFVTFDAAVVPRGDTTPAGAVALLPPLGKAA